MAITYPPYNLYQPQIVASQEIPIAPIPKETNESLLLNLTKKMEELAVNMAKEKEKWPKQTQFRTNIWLLIVKDRAIRYKIVLHPLI